MPIGQDLIEGLAEAAHNQGAVNRIEADKSDRRATAHEELQANTQQILNDVTTLQKRRMGLDPKAPDYRAQIKEIDASLGAHQQALKDLYHPDKNPGALDHLAGFIKQHLGGQKQANIPSTPAQAKQTMAQLQASAAGGGDTPQDPDPYLNADQKRHKALIGAGLEPRATSPRPKFVREDGKDAQGNPMTVYRDAGDPSNVVSATGQPIPEAALEGFKPNPKTSGSAPKVGSFGEFLIASYGDSPTPAQIEQGRKLWAQAGAATTTGTHVVMVPQVDGSIKPITVETTSSKSFGAAPTKLTPGDAKKKVATAAPSAAKASSAKPAGGVVSVGDAVGGKLTAPQSKATTERNEAVALDSIAKQVENKPNDAFNQKRLAVALEKVSAGRFTTQALDYIKKTGWGNTIEEWANSATTGALPADLMRQIIDGAHENLKAKQDALDVAMKPSGGGSGDEMISVQIPGQKPGKIHASQKKAFLDKYPNATVQ